MTALEEIKKALAAAEQFIVNGVELGYIRMPNPETQDSAHDTLPMIRQAQLALERLQSEIEHLSADVKREAELATHMANDCNDAQARAEAAEAEVKRLEAEIDRKSSMPGDHRYWEGRYRDEAAENEKLREALKPFAKFEISELKRRAFLQILVCPEGDDHADNYAPHFIRARTALAITGGQHHAE